jgi:hypothetical protein
MKWGSTLLGAGLLIAGGIAGFSTSSYLVQHGEHEAARAGLLGASDCLRRGDPVCAMTYAQRASNNAPEAYEPYESIGDAYVALGIPSAAHKMYSLAIDRLASSGEEAMLVTRGAISPQAAKQLLRRKLEVPGAARSLESPPQQKP